MSFDTRLLNGLGVLSAVVEAGSFVAASRTVGLTQSGVSRAIARLEARLGIRLLHRTARSVTLTDEGRRFYERVRPLLANLEDATNQAASSRSQVRGHLRVHVDPLFAQVILAPRLPAFLRAHPELTIELLVRNRLVDMTAEAIDVAIRFGEPENSSLVARKLFETRVQTCASPAYLERVGRPSHPRELADKKYDCVQFYDPRASGAYAWEFHRGRRVLRVAVAGQMTLNDPATMLAACIAGHGITQLLDIAAAEPLRDGRLVELFPEWSDERFPAYVFMPSRQQPPAKLRAFLDLVTQHES